MKFITMFTILLLFFCCLSDAKKKKKNAKSKNKSSKLKSIKKNIKTKKSSIKARDEHYIFDKPNADDDIISEYGIVFSWHSQAESNTKLNDVRWEYKRIGAGNEFRVAVLSCKEAHPEIPIYLFTNLKTIDPDIRANIFRVYYVDLLKDAKLDEVIERTGDTKFGFATKAQSLLTGWDLGVLPDKVLHLDVDIILLSTSERRNLYNLFEPLKFYDMAAVMEGYSTSLTDPLKGTPAVGMGWEINTGVFATRKSSRGLLEKWIEAFRDSPELFHDFESGEQQALMLAFERNPQYRWFPLPPVFNFRRSSLFARNGPSLPVIVHTHIYHYEQARVDNYKEVAKHAAVIMFEDGLHHLTRQGADHHFICDMIVA